MSNFRSCLKSLLKGKFLLPFILLALIALFLFNSKPEKISAEGDTNPPTILNVSPEDRSYTPYHKFLIVQMYYDTMRELTR